MPKTLRLNDWAGFALLYNCPQYAGTSTTRNDKKLEGAYYKSNA